MINTDVFIGDRVRYLTSIEWGPSQGNRGVVTHVYSDGAFSVKLDDGTGEYYTLRQQVCPEKYD